jgi:hypothetical protein
MSSLGEYSEPNLQPLPCEGRGAVVAIACEYHEHLRTLGARTVQVNEVAGR